MKYINVYTTNDKIVIEVTDDRNGKVPGDNYVGTAIEQSKITANIFIGLLDVLRMRLKKDSTLYRKAGSLIDGFFKGEDMLARNLVSLSM